MKLPLVRLAARLFGEPLAIQPAKLEIIVQALGPRLRGDTDYMDEPEDARTRKALQVDADGVAYIDISGTLVSKASGMGALSGLSSYASIGEEFYAALADPKVKGILLCIDSPGGEVQGMFELADSIYEARGQKPIVAFASTAASAAYMLASSADKVIVPQTGITGSIGIIAMHLDETKADEKAGLKYTAVYAGERKNDGNPHFPLSEEALASMQDRVNTIYGMFVAAVARTRGLSEKAIRGQQAKIFMGQDGVAAGLADLIGTEDDARALLLRSSGQRSGRKSIAAEASSTAPAAENHQTTEVVMAEQQNTAPAEANVPTAADIDAMVNAARESGLDAAAEIADLCVLAGAPEKATEFIAAKKSPSAVRAELMKAVADKQKTTAVDPALMPGADAGKDKPKVGAAKPWKEIFKGLGFAKKEVK